MQAHGLCDFYDYGLDGMQLHAPPHAVSNEHSSQSAVLLLTKRKG